MRKAFLILIVGASLGGCAVESGYYADDGPYLYDRSNVDVGIGFYGFGGGYGGSYYGGGYRHYSGHHGSHHGGHHKSHGGGHHRSHGGGHHR